MLLLNKSLIRQYAAVCLFLDSVTSLDTLRISIYFETFNNDLKFLVHCKRYGYKNPNENY